MIRKVVLVIFWVVLIFIINQLGRYLYVEFFRGGYHWIKEFYIVIAGSIATLITIILFFAANYMVTKKRKKQELLSFTKTRLFIMIVSVIIVFIGEQTYLFFSDYFL